MKPNKRFLCCLTGGLLLVASLGRSAPSQPWLSDDFALNRSGRRAGTLIDGQSPQIGPGFWMADSALVFDPSGGLILKEQGSTTLGIPFRFSDVQNQGSVVTVCLTVLPKVEGWVAISFGSKVSLNDFFPTTKFWALVGPDGKWEVRDGYTFDRTPRVFTKGQVILERDQLIRLALSYDESAGELVDFQINGVSVSSGVTFDSVRPWPVGAVSFKAFKAKAGLQIKDFQIFVTRPGEPLPVL